MAWYNLGNTLAKLERLDESNEALDLAIAIEERFSSAYFSKARNLLVSARYEEAITCYEETLAFDGPQAITFSFIGECYEKMEKYEQALIHYDQAIALDPTWVDAWIGRGVVKDMQERLPDAVKDLEQAVHIGADNPDAWYYYANALGRSEKYEQALKAYEKLNTIEPQSLEGWMDHADLLLTLKGPDAALRKFPRRRTGPQAHPPLQVPPRELPAPGRPRATSLLRWKKPSWRNTPPTRSSLEHYPEAAALPQVMHLLELYQK